MSQSGLTEEQRITACKTNVARIYTMLQGNPDDWQDFVSLARSIIANLNFTSFMRHPARVGEQAWVVDGLQQLAYQDPDSGGVSDVAAWCSQQWLLIFQHDAQNVTALKGTRTDPIEFSC